MTGRLIKTFQLQASNGKPTIEVTASRSGKEWKAKCPFHDDHDPSLSINEEKGVYHCFGCETVGRIVDPYSPEHGSRKSQKGPSEIYDYVDEKGSLIYQVLRYKPKNFIQRRPKENGGWEYSIEGVRRVPYRLPELVKSAGPVFIVEGEKDVDTLADRGVTATTNSGGAGKWLPEFSTYLKDRDVVVLPDNDAVGREHAERVVRSLVGKARSIKLITLPGLAEKEDVTDWLQVHKHDSTELLDLVGSSPEYNSDTKPAPGPYQESQAPLIMERFLPRPFTNLLLERLKFFSTGTTDRDRLFYYSEREGIWLPNGEDMVVNQLRAGNGILDDRHKKISPIKEIIADLKGVSWKEGQDDLPEPDLNLIPLHNAVFDLRAGSSRPFKPDDYFTWKLPWRADPMGSHEFVDLVDSFLPTERNSDLWELLAYSLWRDYSYQKFFILTGRGSNGKSLFQSLFVNLLGKENVAGQSLDDFQSNRFATASLHKKLLNISGEVSYGDLSDTRLLKQLTGGDIVTADVKYLNSIQFANYAKLVFLTNQVPTTRDTTDGFYRRAYIIEFPKQFDENPELVQKVNDLFSSRDMYEALLHVLLGQLKALKDQRFIFSRHRSPEELRNQYESLSNPLTRFIDNQCERILDNLISKREFLERLNRWLREQGFNGYSGERVGKEMKALGFEGRRPSVEPSSSQRVSSWVGLGWRTL